MSIHTIPVPAGWSPEQTWEHLAHGGLLQHPEGEDKATWTNVEVAELTTEPLPNGDEKVTGGRLVRWWQ